MESKITLFNEIPVHSVFIWSNSGWRSNYGQKFIKLANAIPNVGMSKQPPNCFDLQNGHYCTMGAKHEVQVVKKISDFDDSIDCFNRARRNRIDYTSFYINSNVKKIIFNGPATIVLWEDGTKTVVKCQEGDVFDKEKGIALCFMKKHGHNKANFNNILKKWTKEEEGEGK